MRRLYHALRVVIKAVRSGKIQLIDVKGRGEDFTGKELFQHYGFASRPLNGAEGILLFIGGADNAVVVATEDRRYRIALENGEAAIYTDEGDKIHLKRNREMLIQTGGVLNVIAATTVNVAAPMVNLGAAAGGKFIPTEDFMTLYNTHTHNSGPVPDQQAGSSHRTTKVKAV